MASAVECLMAPGDKFPILLSGFVDRGSSGISSGGAARGQCQWMNRSWRFLTNGPKKMEIMLAVEILSLKNNRNGCPFLSFVTCTHSAEHASISETMLWNLPGLKALLAGVCLICSDPQCACSLSTPLGPLP